MANIKSQIKRIRTNEKRASATSRSSSARPTAVRRFREAAEAGDARPPSCARGVAALDKAASKGVIHKNQAANRKSAMAKRVNALPERA